MVTPQRYVAFIDDPEDLGRVRQRFGMDNVLAVSAQAVGHGVLQFQAGDLEAGLAGVEAEHRARPFAGVLSWREPYVVLAARLATRLGLPQALPDPMLARDKLRMKQALSPAVRCARAAPIDDAADLERAPDDQFPGVLKPRYGFASICAVRVDSRRDARRELREKRDKLRITHIERVDPCIPPGDAFVLESFVGGTEHTVDSFVVDGEVVLSIVSDKLPMVAPHFVEVGDVMPSQLDRESRERIATAARRGIAALGIRYGWTHAEIKLWRGEAWVMEIAARMGGGYTRELVEAAYGLDMLGALFDWIADGTTPVLGEKRADVMARRIVISGVGLVWSTRGIERLAEAGRIKIVRRESRRLGRRVLLGAPYSYAGTLVAYLLSARDAEELSRLSAAIEAEAAPAHVEVMLPRPLYQAYLAAKGALDATRGR